MSVELRNIGFDIPSLNIGKTSKKYAPSSPQATTGPENYQEKTDETAINCDPYGDLQPLISAKSKLENLLSYLNSREVLLACENSQSLKILHGRLLTSLFHLNLQPKIVEKNKPNYTFISNNYPYDPVYEHPFPKRPTLEVIDEALHFANYIDTDASKEIVRILSSFGPYRSFAFELKNRVAGEPSQTIGIEKEDIVANPVDSYFIMKQRLMKQGETASFPEFAESVDKLLEELQSASIIDLAKTDLVFSSELEKAKTKLEEVKQSKGEATQTEAAFNTPFPYRRTINAIEQAIGLFDLAERLKHPESKNWFEVEESWYTSKEEKVAKLLPLYHFNRYKYQKFGLLANPHVVLIPWYGDVLMETLVRLRPTPIGLIGVTAQTIRADRHHNSPLDFWYHDLNHIRRMWGYDKQSIREKSLDSDDQQKVEMKHRQQFLEELLEKTNPNSEGLTEEQKQIRELERFIIFETFHETALNGTRESLLNDLTRGPATPQPFEVQIQDDNYLKETNRQFDGNLRSGANHLKVTFSKPTIVQYFFDRAPGFLSNVYNKLAWGFYDSVFTERQNQKNVTFRTPEYLALATSSLLQKLGYHEIEIPSLSVLINLIKDRSGQPELYNYFALRSEDDLSEKVRSHIHETQGPDIVRPEIKNARTLKLRHIELTPAEVASKVMTTQEHKVIIRWMVTDLQDYNDRFDELFDAKLSRGAVKEFIDSDDYVNQFVGNERGKLLKTYPSAEAIQAMNNGGKLYVDTWAVPFFNTATQSRAEAHEGIKKTLEYFKKINLDDNISMLEFANLVAMYARPEFDDLRRFKLQIFPSTEQLTKYGSERSDAKAIGDRYPEETFIVTNKELGLDDLSFTFGRRIHYMGLIPHSETIRADGRVFVGTADFFEHDQSHGYFSLHPSVPGHPREWIKIHEEFRLIQAQIPDQKKREMNSLIYFHFTHESAYKSMIPDEKGTPPKPDAYKDELKTIIERIETPNDYDWMKLPEHFGEDYLPLLQESFEEITLFFKQCLNKVKTQS